MIRIIESNDLYADWIKTLSWDLPTDVESFLLVIGGMQQLDHFMTLPAAQAMPDDLKVALNGIPFFKHLAGRHDQSTHAGGRARAASGSEKKPASRRMNAVDSSFDRLPISESTPENSALSLYARNENSKAINSRLYQWGGAEPQPMPEYFKNVYKEGAQERWDEKEELELKPIRDITAIIESSPPLDEDLVFLRRTSGSELPEGAIRTTAESLQALEGTILENKGFTSTTSVFAKQGDSKPYIHEFAQEDSSYTISYRISAPKGTKGVRGSEIENEFILQRGTKFLVTKVDVIRPPEPMNVPGIGSFTLPAEVNIEVTIVGQNAS
jgi:hypothetical protein